MNGRRRPLKPSRLTWVAIAWVTGYGLDCWLLPGHWIWGVAVGLLSLLSWTCFWNSRSFNGSLVKRSDRAGPGPTLSSSRSIGRWTGRFLLLTLVAVGGWWSDSCRPGSRLQIGRLAPTNDQQTQLVRVRGSLVSITPLVQQPEQNLLESFRFSDSQFRFVVEVQAYERDDGWHPSGGRLLCELSAALPRSDAPDSGPLVQRPVSPLSFPAQIGQNLELFGQISLPPIAKNPGQFNHRRNLWLSGFDAELTLNDVRQIRPLADDVPWTAWGWRLRDHFKRLLRQHLTDEQYPMGAAILLGDRSLLASELRQQYAATGTVHVLAISGLHLGILAGAMLWIGRWAFVPHLPVYIATIVLVIFYAWLVEFRPPIVRAAILTSAMCLATLLGRRAFSLHSLSLALVVVYLLQPHQLAEPGTQLSFLAVAAIVGYVNLRSRTAANPLQQLVLAQRSGWQRALAHWGGQVRDAYACGAVVFFICLPLVIHYFNICAWIGLVINPVIILPMTLALLCGFAVFLLSPFSTFLADGLGACCSLCLSVMDQIVAAAYQVPGSYSWVTSPGVFWVVVCYLWLCFLVAGPRFPAFRSVAVVGSAAIVLAAYLFPWPIRPDRVDVHGSDPAMILTFVDVGHGNSVILRTPDQRIIVFDAGSFPSARQAGNRIGGVLLAHGIQRVDSLVVSHADLDHYNGVPELLRRFSIRQFVGPPNLFADPSPYVQFLKATVSDSGVVQHWVKAGDRLCSGDDWEIRVLSPPLTPYSDGDNSNSLVLEVQFGAARLLLTADVEGDGLQSLLTRDHPGYQLIQVPHHGSHHSQPTAFATWARADLAIVSAHSRRVPDATRSAYQQAGSPVLITDETGAVLVTVFPDGRLTHRAYLQQPWPTR